MAAVWGIDVGKAALKAVKLRHTKEGLEIQAVEYIPYPLDDDEDEREEHESNSIRQFLTKHKIGAGDQVVVGLPGLHAFSRFIKLPPVDASKVPSLVRLEAQQQIPFPIAEVNWDFVQIPGDPGDEVEVGIFATRSELVDGFLDQLRDNGLQPDVVTIAPLAVYNFVRYNDDEQDGATIILDVGAEHTDLVIVDGERFWIRNLRIAGNDITKALAERFKVPFPEAEKLKRSSSKSQQAKKIFGTMEPVLKDLVGEVHRSVGFFKSQADELDIKRLVLIGDGSKLKNLGKFLKEQLRYKVRRIQQLEADKFIIDPDVDLDVLKNHLLGFGVALGLGVQGVGEAHCAINLAPQQIQLQSKLRSKLPWAAGAAALSWLTLGIGYLGVQSSAGELKQVQGKLNQVNQWQQVQSDAMAVQDVSSYETQASALTSLGEGRTLVLQLLDKLRTVLPAQNDRLADFQRNEMEELHRQIQAYEDAVEQQGVNADKLWILELRIQHRVDKDAPNRYLVEMLVGKMVPRALLGRETELRDQIKSRFASELASALTGPPFWVRNPEEPAPDGYGDVFVGVYDPIFGLHPTRTQDDGTRRSFRCVKVPIKFEIGVPKPEPKPEPAAGEVVDDGTVPPEGQY